MATPTNKQRVKRLYQMLFELATGNLNFRIEEHTPFDTLSDIEKLLNQLAQKMKIQLESLEGVIPFYSYQSLTQHTIVLNNKSQIIFFSQEIPSVMEIQKESLIKSQFENIIAPQSKNLWKTVKQEIANESTYYNTLHLIFISNTNKVIPLFCTIFKLYHSDYIFITSITTIIEDLIDSEKKELLQSNDQAIIQNIYLYITTHLEEQLPTTKELSKMFGTNEFKLKEIFRNHFNTSIYQFYNDQRLKRAHQMISQTIIPLKEIAYLNGFNDYVIFSKAFKKKYNYAPSTLKRLNESS